MPKNKFNWKGFGKDKIITHHPLLDIFVHYVPILDPLEHRLNKKIIVNSLYLDICSCYHFYFKKIELSLYVLLNYLLIKL